MTDKETLIAMFDRAGVKYTIDLNMVTVESGYSGFFTEFVFDVEGKLLRVGAFE